MQSQTLASLFVNSQFNCYTTVRMLCSRKPKLLSKTKKNYKDLLLDHDETSIHQKYSQFLATVVFLGQIN